MRKSLCLVLLAALLSPALVHAQEEFQKAKFQSQVSLTVSRIKSTRVAGGDWDDKTDRLTFKVILKNPSNVSFPGLTMSFYLFGQNMEDTKRFKLLQADKQSFDLPAFRDVELMTPEVVTMWDDNGAVFGEKYKGWIVRIYAPDGSLLLDKSTSSFFTNTRVLDTLTVGNYYKKDLTPAN